MLRRVLLATALVLTAVVAPASPAFAAPGRTATGTGAGDADADYSRAMSASQSVDGIADTDWESLRGNYNQLRKLKVRYPQLKVLISTGGWTYSKFFSNAALTPASREKLVRSCIDIYLKGNLPAYNGAGGPGTAAGIFDGIDLDWEWPGSEGHPGNIVRPEDKANNTLLMAAFRRQMDELTVTSGKRYLLTAFTPADPVPNCTVLPRPPVDLHLLLHRQRRAVVVL